MKQSIDQRTMVALVVVAAVVIIGVASWLAFGRSGAYYGGRRTVPRRPPAMTAATAQRPGAPSAPGVPR